MIGQTVLRLGVKTKKASIPLTLDSPGDIFYKPPRLHVVPSPVGKRFGVEFGIYARVAQLVEQRIENPRVGGSNPPPGTI